MNIVKHKYKKIYPWIFFEINCIVNAFLFNLLKWKKRVKTRIEIILNDFKKNYIILN
jgi:hypothetical protein